MNVSIYKTVLTRFLLMMVVSIGWASTGSAQEKLCPTGQELLTKADHPYRYNDPLGTAYGTLLWLERGDAMWARHKNDSLALKGRRTDVTVSYKLGLDGYPKDKKTAKRIDKYKDKDYDSSEDMPPRPKGVPARPPASAIAFAEEQLSCKFVPASSGPETPDIRAARIAHRKTCPMTRKFAEYELGNARVLDTDTKDKYEKAWAVLEWALRGEAGFTAVEDGLEIFPEWRRWKLQKLFKYGDGEKLDPRPDLDAAFDAFTNTGATDSRLATVPPDVLRWAEDTLLCRVDLPAWKASEDSINATLAAKKREDQFHRNAFMASLERDLEIAEAREHTRGRWTKPESKNLPDNVVQIGVYFDEAICKGVLQDLEGRGAISADEQAWGNWYAFYGHEDLCGFLPPSYEAWLPNRSAGSGYASGEVGTATNQPTDFS